MVTKREKLKMTEQEQELILNPELKLQKEKVELKEFKEQIISDILFEYLENIENILDIEIWKWVEVIERKIEIINSIKWDLKSSKEKIYSIVNIVNLDVLNKLKKYETNI